MSDNKFLVILAISTFSFLAFVMHLVSRDEISKAKIQACVEHAKPEAVGKCLSEIR